MKKILFLAPLGILLISCGGGSESSSASNVNPTSRLHATLDRLCAENCKNTISSNNPSSKLIGAIEVIDPDYPKVSSIDNPSTKLKAAIDRMSQKQ